MNSVQESGAKHYLVGWFVITDLLRSRTNQKLLRTMMFQKLSPEAGAAFRTGAASPPPVVTPLKWLLSWEWKFVNCKCWKRLYCSFLPPMHVVHSPVLPPSVVRPFALLLRCVLLQATGLQVRLLRKVITQLIRMGSSLLGPPTPAT